VQQGPSVRFIANFPIRAFSAMLVINAAIRNITCEIDRRTLHHAARVGARANLP
jgi:hypothetical protein